MNFCRTLFYLPGSRLLNRTIVNRLYSTDGRETFTNASSNSAKDYHENAEFVTKEEILAKIVKRLEHRGHKILLEENYVEKSIIPLLMTNRFSPSEIVSLMYNNANFLNLTGSQLSPILISFTGCGINAQAALSVILAEPRLLKETPDNIFQLLTALVQIIPNKESLSRFLEENPAVLYEADLESMLKTKLNLNNFFTDTEIHYMARKYPTLLLKDFDYLESLYEYMHYSMRITSQDLSRSRWFNYPLEFIQLRHQFVVLTGHYVFPDYKRPAVAKDNPKIHRIIDTVDADFATNVCHVTFQEYSMFEQVFEEKMKLDDEFGPEFRRKYSRRTEYSVDDEEDWEYYKLGEREATVVDTDDVPKKMVDHWSCKPRKGEFWRKKKRR